MVNRIWPTALAGEAGNSVSSVSALACHTGRPNSVNTFQIVLVYGTCSTVFTYPYLATFKGQGTIENLTLLQIQRSPCDQGVKFGSVKQEIIHARNKILHEKPKTYELHLRLIKGTNYCGKGVILQKNLYKLTLLQ